MTANITGALVQSTLTEAEHLINFLAIYRSPKKDNSGKYSVNLHFVNSLFGPSWEHQVTKSGHTKLKHRVTRIMVEYSAHQDPVDPGAVTTIANQVQDHINLFFYRIMGYSPRVRSLRTNHDFQAIAKQLNQNGVPT